MLSFEPSAPFSSLTLSRRAAFRILVSIGGVLVGVLLFDAYADWVLQGDPLWSTALENSIPVLLGLLIPYVGWRFLQNTPEFPYLPEVARGALMGSVGMILFSGLVMGVHVLQGEIKPVVIVFQLASVGAVAGLWVGYSFARAKEAEQRIGDDRDRLANLLEGLPAPVVHGKFGGDELTILKANAAFEKVFGLNVEKVVGKNLYDLVVSEEKREKAAEIDRRGIEEGLVETEVRRLTNQGPRDFQLRVAQALDEGASETYAIYTDVTERKRRKERLERQNDLFEKAEEIADVGAWEYDLRAEELTLTDQAYRVHGLPPGDHVAPEQVHGLYHSEDRPGVEKAFRRALAEAMPYDVEARVVPEEGDERWVRTLGEPQTKDGEVVRVRGAIQDITDQKRREQDLRLFEQVIEQANDAILVTKAEPLDRPGPEIVYANPAFEEMTGYEEEDIMGKTPRIFQGPKTDGDVLQELRDHLEKGKPWEGSGVNYRKDGEPYVVEWAISPVQDEHEDIEYWVSVQRDVTERNRREERLQTLYTRLQLALEASNTGTFDWDIETGEVIWDKTSERLFGYEPGEFPETFEGWARRVHPEDLAGAREDIKQAIEAQEEYRTEFRTRIPDGQERWIEARGIVEYDHGGEPIRMVGIHTDITDRKKREQKLREARDKAEEAARLKSAMLANMSHEIRTPLTSITGFSEVLEQDLSGQHGDFATKIRRSSQRLQRTLESVLHLSKLESGVHKLKREEVSLGAVAKDVTAVLRDEIAERSLTLETEIPGSPVTGVLNENALHRICRNLLENAIKFTPEGGRVEVRVLDEGQSATLEIEDTGIGMDPETVPELFQAFKQESEGRDREYEGSGLGLSIVQRLTDELGGTVDVETEKGEGTCFAVRLPLTDDVTLDDDAFLGDDA